MLNVRLSSSELHATAQTNTDFNMKEDRNIFQDNFLFTFNKGEPSLHLQKQRTEVTGDMKKI